MTQKLFSNLFFVVLMLICLSARPSKCAPQSNCVDSNIFSSNLPPETEKMLMQCECNEERKELCMRCAKVTKSTFIYPECCGNVEGLRDWCFKYVYYGQDEDN